MLIKMTNDEFKAREMDLLSDSRCGKLVSYLSKRQKNEPTLREVKRNFPQMDLEDSFIEELVEAGVIKRHHGKYQLGLKVIDQNSLQKTYEEVNQLLDSKIDDITEIVRKYNMTTFDTIYALFSNEISHQIIYYEDSELARKLLNYPTRLSKVEGKRTTYISFGSYYPYYSHNISDYFNYLTRNQDNLPSQFIQLRDRLGDINPHYFINYCDRKLRRMEKGKQISVNKSDLFLEALLDMNYCYVSDDSYQYNVTKVSECNLSSWSVELGAELNMDIQKCSFTELSCMLDWFFNKNLVGNLETHHGMI